jgi:cytoskeletal protein CcmA (bactofilin family)
MKETEDMLNALRDRKPRIPGDQDAGIGSNASETPSSKIPEGSIGSRKRSFPMRPTMSQPSSSQTITDQLGMVARHASSVQSDEVTPAPEAEAINQTLTVGRGIKIKGTISDCDSIAVEGHLEASCVSREMQILECGTFRGDAEIETAEISGIFEGNLTVTNRLLIRSSGLVSGVIRYCSIEIEAGGQISGDIQVTEPPSAEGTSDATAAAPQKAEDTPKIQKPAAPAKPEASAEAPKAATPETD